MLFTESFQETEGQPLVLGWAKALKNLAENVPVKIFEDGRWGGRVMASRFKKLLAAVAMLAHSAGYAAEPVTIDNFRRAETDHYFRTYVKKGCFGKLCNERGLRATTVREW